MTSPSAMLQGVMDLLLPPMDLAGAAGAAQAGWHPDEAGTYCPRCGADSAPEALTPSGCSECRDRPLPWAGLWRLGGYRPPLADWIVSLKFAGSWTWAEYFGLTLAQRTPVLDRCLVVPVPLHWLRRLHRGYDQARLVAESFAQAKRLPLADVLRRRRATKAQTRLTSQQMRRRNVRGAFTLARVDLTGWTVWLVDDVLTTGSTARVCARLLLRAGADKVNLAVVAVVPRLAGPGIPADRLLDTPSQAV